VTRGSRRVRPVSIGFFIILCGCALLFFGMTGPDKHESLPRILTIVFGQSLLVSGQFVQDRLEPRRFPIFVGIAGSASATTVLANRLSASLVATDVRYAVATVSFVLLVVPLYGLLRLWRRMQDERQRLVVATSSLVTLVALIVLALGYWIIEKSAHLPAVPSVWIAGIAISVWLIVWLVSARRVA
jgi:hypothetical protein